MKQAIRRLGVEMSESGEGIDPRFVTEDTIVVMPKPLTPAQKERLNSWGKNVVQAVKRTERLLSAQPDHSLRQLINLKIGS